MIDMKDVSISQDDDLSEFEDWAREFNESDADMIPISVVTTWTVRHTNGRHAHVTEVSYPSGNDRSYYEHNEDDGDWICASFDEALASAIAYLNRGETSVKGGKK